MMLCVNSIEHHKAPELAGRFANTVMFAVYIFEAPHVTLHCTTTRTFTGHVTVV